MGKNKRKIRKPKAGKRKIRDQVTREIIRRLLLDSANDFRIIREEPVRGGDIKRKTPMYNSLGLPVIILTDLDTMIDFAMSLERRVPAIA